MAIEPLTAAFELGGKLIDKLFTSPKDKIEAFQKLRELEQSGDLAAMTNQIEVNKIEAASSNFFVAGWRPFIGWICGSALAVQLVVGPTATWIAQVVQHPITLPVMDNQLLTTLLIGMLGLGGMRTVEKIQGVASK